LLDDEGYLAIQSYYDHQDLRIRSMNRIRAIIKARAEGKSLREVEKKKDEKDFADKYADKKLPGILLRLKNEGKIAAEEYEYINNLLNVAKEEKKFEEKYKPLMMDWIGTVPIYQQYLKYIKGLGPVLSAGLIYYIDMTKVHHASSIWKYAGLAPVDGHTVKPMKGRRINYNPDFRTFCWKVGDSLLKKRTQPYRKIYDEEKKRVLEMHENPNYTEIIWDKEQKAWIVGRCKSPPLHAHRRAMRKMIKRFLADYYENWRKVNGQPPDEPYAVAILNHTKEENKQ
jgi:hypothetical protein